MRHGHTRVEAVTAGPGAAERVGQLADRLDSRSEDGPRDVGHVVRAFDRSVYIACPSLHSPETPVQPLIAVGRADLPDSPLLARVDTDPGFSFRRLGLDPDAGCRGWLARTGEEPVVHLSVGQVLDVRIERSTLEPTPDAAQPMWAPAAVGPGHAVRDRSRALLRHLLDRGLADGLGWFERLDAHRRTRDKELATLATDVATRLAGPDKPGRPVPPAVLELLGRGPGSTPSGDDLLGGLLLACARAADPELRSSVAALGRATAAAAVDRTTILSAAVLEQAALGRAPAAVQDTLNVVLGGSDGSEPEFDSIVADAARIGHTSGLDTLAGILTATLVVAPALRPEGSRTPP